jgi:precorrin-4 methylase
MVLFTMRDTFQSFIAALLTEYPSETPLAIVRHAGQRERQRVDVTTLGTAFQAVKGDDLGFEYLIYVGDFLTFRYAEHAEPVKP